MALVLNSREFAAHHQRLAARFKPAIMRGVHSGAARSVAYLVDRTRKAPPANPAGVGTGGAVNTGNFARRWRSVRLPDGAELVNDAPYGSIVDPPSGDYGRRPGAKFPPKAALVAWIKRRLLTKLRPKKAGSRPAEADRERAARDRKIRDVVRGPREERKPKPARPERAAGGGRRSASLDAQAERLYFPVARAIARRGLQARRILHDPQARRDILDFVHADVVRELEAEASKR